jgi:protein-disulfide isomerase
MLVSGLALAAAVIVTIALAQKAAPPRASGTDGLVLSTTSYPQGLISGQALGRLDAPVTLEVWSDFQCPYCGMFARTYLPRLVSDFVAAGQLRIVARDVAFVDRGTSTESADAAVAAACSADQGRYWQYHDLLFWNQNGENNGAFDDNRLGAMADKLVLDRPSWDACRADPKRARAVAATTSDAVAAGINSTPTLVLNGAVNAGLPRTYDDLANAIRARLAPTPGPSAS